MIEILLNVLLAVNVLDLTIYYIQYRRTRILMTGIAFYVLDLARRLLIDFDYRNAARISSILTIAVLIVMSHETRKALKQ